MLVSSNLSDQVVTMVRELRARLGSAKLLLQSLQGDTHKVASRAQAAAFLEALKGVGDSLTRTARADLMVFAGEVAWHSDDKASILGALDEPSPPSKAKARRRDMQDFRNITETFTEAEWSKILSEDVSFLQIREIILTRAVKLSCRCPCEKSSKRFTTILLLCSGKSDLPSNSKWDIKESLKKEIKGMARRMEPPLVYLQYLYSSPQELMAMHPDLYSAAYRGTEVPVPCKLDIHQVLYIDATYRTRGGGGVVSSVDLPASPPPLQMLGSAGGANAGNIATTLMQGLFTMAQSQERMMNMIMCSAMPQGSANRPMRSLSALADLASPGGQAQLRLSDIASQPEVTVTDLRPQLAALGTSEQVVDSALPATSMAAAAAPPPPSDDVAEAASPKAAPSVLQKCNARIISINTPFMCSHLLSTRNRHT